MSPEDEKELEHELDCMNKVNNQTKKLLDDALRSLQIQNDDIERLEQIIGLTDIFIELFTDRVEK